MNAETTRYLELLEQRIVLLASLSFVLVARTALRSASRWPLGLAIGSAVIFASGHVLELPEGVEASALMLMTVASVWAHFARRAPCCAVHAASHSRPGYQQGMELDSALKQPSRVPRAGR